MSGHELTVCTVSFHSREYLELNLALTRSLNPSAPIAWLVIENTPHGADGRLDEESNGFVVAEGVDASQTGKYGGSYHHGAALDKALLHINTRFALVLDPDFFIIRPGWAADVIEHMMANDLAFFGVPWHPRWYRKPRYFPCVHCMFIDMDQVAKEDITFLPDLLNNPRPFTSGTWRNYMDVRNQGQGLRAFWAIARLPWRTLAEDLRQRLLIGSSRDTGHHLHRKYGKQSRIRHEQVKPVFRPQQAGFIPEDVSPLQISKIVESLLPDRFSYVPKRKHYYSEIGFRELTGVDVASLGWEEFTWQDKPFGFHVRGYVQRDAKPENGTLGSADIRDILGRLAAVIPAWPKPYHSA